MSDLFPCSFQIIKKKSTLDYIMGNDVSNDVSNRVILLFHLIMH